MTNLNTANTSKPNQFTMLHHKISSISTIEHNGKSYKFTLNHKVVYSYLLGLQVNVEEVFPSYNKMAEIFGVTSKSIEKWISALEEMGLITKTNREGGSNIYTVLPINSSKGRSYSENKGTRHEEQQTYSENVPSAIDVADIDDPFPILEKPKESASSTEYPDYYQNSYSDYNNQEENIDDFLASCGQYQSQPPDKLKNESPNHESEDYLLPF